MEKLIINFNGKNFIAKSEDLYSESYDTMKFIFTLSSEWDILHYFDEYNGEDGIPEFIYCHDPELDCWAVGVYSGIMSSTNFYELKTIIELNKALSARLVNHDNWEDYVPMLLFPVYYEKDFPDKVKNDALLSRG